ncbi:MAG: hypothetical protein H8E13_08955 [Actinobacteria bacterium]|nr:hypothetical protein [Actinomycetota bacterium]
MSKQEWLDELLVVDEYGRELNLSDLPMTLMKRSKIFKLRNYDEKTINNLWTQKK